MSARGEALSVWNVGCTSAGLDTPPSETMGGPVRIQLLDVLGGHGNRPAQSIISSVVPMRAAAAFDVSQSTLAHHQAIAGAPDELANHLSTTGRI